ncbi:hypothetical protein CLAFUW4_08335 [Fulvia fulva]|uniref:Uncharacterized protein n=1 Tax=Passalora fulva TaxID=5499 RepID=A0A9Q8LD29_PASFU|nr:uncharacterized protein CLAFUR5_08443 [Fulvia fulva]KAK4629653.1 hypothetical protein CLAFUR4_08340 [Fulvia fulva]UJO15260.1 hypothetical protein CLAFUR5_08443 [Fulvia fulva]WPV12610.1 hypothetical protein CLAFUW4_08335 [Fulvia fulva]WPV27846.1 hypothetical protein CLAFUW7_08335 [Fulvia fulva]
MEATPALNRNIFRFFDLPGEIRNDIYDHSLHTKKYRRCCLKITVSKVATVNPLLVSRQFSAEYSSRAEPTVTITELGAEKYRDARMLIPSHSAEGRLCPRDFWAAHHVIRQIQIPAIVLQSFHLDMNLESHTDLAQVKKWLERLTGNMVGVHKFTLRFNIRQRHMDQFFVEQGWQERALDIQQELNAGCWTVLPHLQGLELHVDREEDALPDFETRNLIMAWSNKTGRVEPAQDPEESDGTAE